MAGTNKKTAAGGNPTAAKKNTTTKIIAVPLDVVNMSDKEIIDAAVDRLHQQDKEANYDRCGQIMHAAVRDALCEFCRQNAEFARAICQTDKHLHDCLKHVAEGCGNGISDFDAFTRAVDFYFSGAKISFKMLIDVGDGVLNESEPEKPEPQKPLEIALDNLMDW